ncbi:MAG: Asp-tRNA(Asn)/Glu-tRNA(Gln) amidotransferase subunit GatA [Leptospiraceae bacterium]|nr:Asp-tRNA(Asn)/Glu-tRNA(Gln) amidotransferase subunit GatA [Leptospiraceae bacterium]MCK6380571.1 Asp-tRNA(Asn)/Glu-tRNA(Gln) amidotransferase subunit GatA [Leptospiraceae bacterium]
MNFMKYSEIKKNLNEKKISSEEVCKIYLKRIEEVEPKINAFLEMNFEEIMRQAKLSDQRRSSGKPLSELDGIPIGIKDNICIQGVKTTCASKILENFISPYDATAITKLKEKGLVLFPRLNMDEFAMGSSTENSAFQITKNPFDTTRIPGGSSGGSAASVAASMLPIALGSDTGGSIRQPASLCGVWGLKPTYGTVSRYGLVAYASSLDQIGPISNDPTGISDILEVISGFDSNDSTSAKRKSFSFSSSDKVAIKDLKIGIMANEGKDWDADVYKEFQRAIEILKKSGAKIYELDFSLHSYSIPIYYLIATAECSSNLSRFDGIRFGLRKESSKLEDLYLDSRTEGFGKEVKRRIILGTFALSSGYYEAYYGKALAARRVIRKNYKDFFEKVDFILQPTSPTTAFKIGEKTKDPIQMYKADIMTTSVNLAGIGAISIPLGKDSKGLPIGLQISADSFQEGRLLSFVNELDRLGEFMIELPRTIQ